MAWVVLFAKYHKFSGEKRNRNQCFEGRIWKPDTFFRQVAALKEVNGLKDMNLCTTLSRPRMWLLVDQGLLAVNIL
jgi:hypothetical protein